jgi:uncharacterized phiE125 gp8 family phage protein
MMKWILLSGPAIEPVSLAEAKSWLRLDGSEEDGLLTSLIASARRTLEAYTRRCFVTQYWRLFRDAWPGTNNGLDLIITIPLTPFQKVTAIRVYDSVNSAHLISAETYFAPIATDLPRVTFWTEPPPPGRSTDGVEIDVVAGYGDQASDTPEPLRCAILMLIAYWHENRGDEQATGTGIPADVRALAGPFRRERLI